MVSENLAEERKRRFPLPFHEPPNPVEALETFNELVRGLDEATKQLDRSLGSLPSEPARLTAPPIRLKESFAKELLSDLSRVDEQAGRALGFLRDEKVGDAAKLLMEEAERISDKCPPCSDYLKKGALEAGLAATSRNLGEEGWRTYLSRAEGTLSKLRRDALPRVKRSIEISR